LASIKIWTVSWLRYADQPIIHTLCPSILSHCHTISQLIDIDTCARHEDTVRNLLSQLIIKILLLRLSRECININVHVLECMWEMIKMCFLWQGHIGGIWIFFKQRSLGFAYCPTWLHWIIVVCFQNVIFKFDCK